MKVKFPFRGFKQQQPVGCHGDPCHEASNRVDVPSHPTVTGRSHTDSGTSTGRAMGVLSAGSHQLSATWTASSMIAR